MIYRFREDYYKAINACNVKCDSIEFIEFMLAIIKFVLTEANNTSEEVAIEKAADKTEENRKIIAKLKEYERSGEVEGNGKGTVLPKCGTVPFLL